MGENIILDKSFDFAIEVINICNYLNIEKKQFIISNQLLRSGTSIGANVREGVNAISKRDFRFKMSIALKEANETEYWIELIRKCCILDINSTENLLGKCKELCRILSCIVRNSEESN